MWFLLAWLLLGSLRRSELWLFLNNKFHHIIVPEDPVPDAMFWRVKLALAVLQSVPPLSFVVRSISPVHFSVSVAIICLVIALVHVAGIPSEDAVAVLAILIILSLVLVTVSN